MDFDDCPPPLPPPEVEDENKEEVPEEPPMTTMDGAGGDAWILRGLDAMRSRASYDEPKPVTPPPAAVAEHVAAAVVSDEEEFNVPPPPPPLEDAVEAEVATDAVPPPPPPLPPTTSASGEEDHKHGAQLDSTNSRTVVLFGIEQPTAEPIVVPNPDNEPLVIPANEVPPVLSHEEEERLRQNALAAELDADISTSIQQVHHSNKGSRRASVTAANDVAFDEADGIDAAARITEAVVAQNVELADQQEEEEDHRHDEAGPIAPQNTVVNYDEDTTLIARTAALTAVDHNLVSADDNGNNAPSQDTVDNLREMLAEVTRPRLDEAFVAAHDNLETITNDDDTTADPTPVPTNEGFSPYQATTSAQFASETFNYSDAVRSPTDEGQPLTPRNNEDEEQMSDEKEAGVRSNDATMSNGPDQTPGNLDVLSNETVASTSDNAGETYARVAAEESDVEDDNKYSRLPVGDPVVRHSEFDAFASRAVELIQNLQDQKDADVSTLNDDLRTLHETLKGDTTEEISTAVGSLEEKLKSDYMNHIGALQQYLDTKVADVIDRGDKFVLENVEAMKQHVAFEVQACESRVEVAMLEQRRKYKEKFAAVAEKINYMQESIDVMQQALQRAMDLEQFPEPREIPEGKKIRLQVRLEVTNIKPVPIILVPISEKANVADLKHEAIRRARRQGTIADSVVYSKTAINFENLTLFDDDDFADIGLDRGDLTVSLIFTGAEAAVQRHYDATANGATSSSAPSVSAPHPQPSANIFTSTGIMNMPPPPMPQSDTSSSHHAAHAGAVGPSPQQMPPPPPPMTMMANFPSAPSRPNLTASKDIITGYFLREELAKDINEQETLERRLMGELERMERDPLKNQESLCRIRLAKDTINRIRASLLDKATYCYQEAHRAAARATLANIQNVMDNPTSSVDDFIRASNEAQRVVNGLDTNSGEQGRIDALEEAAARNQAKKERMKDDLEELGYELRNKLRVDYDLMPMAERLLDQIDRCSILAASMTLEELDEVHNRVVSFMASVKAKQRQ